jgi:hypothetical protein
MAQTIKRLRLALDELEKCECTPLDSNHAVHHTMFEDAFMKIADEVEKHVVMSKPEGVRIIKRILTACFGEAKVAEMTQDELNKKFDWLFTMFGPKIGVVPAMGHADAWAAQIEKQRLMDFSSRQISELLLRFMPKSFMFACITPYHRLLELVRSEPWNTKPEAYQQFLKTESMAEIVPNAFYATAKED